ncbi:MAG: B12-binding domain-containing protein [Asgard group archaeon]
MDNPALNGLVESLKEGESSKASSSLRTLLSQGVDIKTILVDGIFKAVLEIGEAICSVPEYSEEEKVAMKKWTESLMALYGVLMEIDANIKVPEPPVGKAIFACVTGEGHIMIKEVLARIFNVNGFKIYNFPQPASADMVMKKIREMDANLLVLSAEYTATITTIKEIIELLKKEGLREKVKIILGGGLLNKDLKGLDKEIDLLTNDVLKSVEEAKNLIK